MPTDTGPDHTMHRQDMEPALANLVIRAADGRAEPEGPAAAPLLRGLIDWCNKLGRRTGAEHAPRPPLWVSVTDIDGRQIYAEENAGAETTLPLPPGTYHVLARTRGLERRYTLVLGPRETTHLHLHLRTAPRAD